MVAKCQRECESNISNIGGKSLISNIIAAEIEMTDNT
jgi:hypothetical protein